MSHEINPIPIWTTADILEAVRGERLSGDSHRTFSGISIDSRQVSPDRIFIAIKGERHDGHRFIQDVIQLGVKGVLIAKDKIPDLPCSEWKRSGIVCIAVDDTRKALGRLAAFHRRRSKAFVAAITGSNGKTTTKEMTAAVLSQRFRVLSTQGNLNNDIGLPLTLLNLEASHEWAVVELGMNHAGEIAALTHICQPDIGVITNIGPAHIGCLGSMDAIMRAKGELIETMKPEAVAVLNADDPRTRQLAQETSKTVIRFGLSESADIRAVLVSETPNGTEFVLSLPNRTVSVTLAIPGKIMVYNALAAAAVGSSLGLKPEEISQGLEQFKPVKGRMNRLLINAIHIIDDTYNANPSSMEAAINTLKSLRGPHRGFLVIGDMMELGGFSESMHRHIGSLAADSGISGLYVFGQFADAVVQGAREHGMNPHNIFQGTKEEIVRELTDILQPDDYVLIKGSRSTGMESIVNEVRSALS